MIEINLLPENLRKRKKVELKIELLELSKKSILSMGIGLLALLIVIHLAMGLIIGLKTHTFNRLNEKWETILPMKKDVDFLNEKIKKLEAKIAIIDQLMINRFLWAKKMNELSDLIISGIWFRNLSIDSNNNSLVIDGTVASRKGEEMVLIGRFMGNLKENQSFFKDFKDIELKSIQRRNIKDAEVMDFILICYFKTK